MSLLRGDDKDPPHAPCSTHKVSPQSSVSWIQDFSMVFLHPRVLFCVFLLLLKYEAISLLGEVHLPRPRDSKCPIGCQGHVDCEKGHWKGQLIWTSRSYALDDFWGRGYEVYRQVWLFRANKITSQKTTFFAEDVQYGSVWETKVISFDVWEEGSSLAINIILIHNGPWRCVQLATPWSSHRLSAVTGNNSTSAGGIMDISRCRCG